MNDFKKLQVWQDSMDLTVEVYRHTGSFPSSERFNLISQINRSAVSIPSNIAEGAGRSTDGEFGQFLGITNGSLTELETQIILAYRLQFMTEPDYKQLSLKIESIRRMLFRLMQSLKKKQKP